MRRFLIVGHRAVTTPTFLLDDLPGAGGRMDLVLNAVTAALLVSHGIRHDAEITLLLLGPPDPPRAVRFAGGEIESLNPDDRSNAALVRRALARPSESDLKPGHPAGGDPHRMEWKASPGVYSSKRGLEEVLAETTGGVVLLVENGKDIRKADLPRDSLFVLSDTEDLTPQEERTVMARGAVRVTLGPTSIHTSQAIAVVHNELDRREAGA